MTKAIFKIKTRLEDLHYLISRLTIKLQNLNSLVVLAKIYINQQKRIEGLERDSHLFSQLIFNKNAKAKPKGKKERHFSKWC